MENTRPKVCEICSRYEGDCQGSNQECCERRNNLFLTVEEKIGLFKQYPCLDCSFEDGYSSEVSILLEAQIDKVLRIYNL